LLTLLFLDTTSCSTAKGGCPHICLPQGGGKKCVCADHYNYTASDNTCTLMPTKGKSSISLFFKKKTRSEVRSEPNTSRIRPVCFD